MTLTNVVEALLFGAQKPLTSRELLAAVKGAGKDDELVSNDFARTSEAEIAATLESLKIDYIQHDRAFQLLEKAEGWQLASDPAYAPWVRQLFPAAKPARLTPPSLETLAIVAYQQPVTRSEIESVRGVDSSGVLATLHNRGLVDAIGRLPSVGNPIQYGTTVEFLRLFGLRSLDDLPPLGQIEGRDISTALTAAVASASGSDEIPEPER